MVKNRGNNVGAESGQRKKKGKRVVRRSEPSADEANNVVDQTMEDFQELEFEEENGEDRLLKRERELERREEELRVRDREVEGMRKFYEKAAVTGKRRERETKARGGVGFSVGSSLSKKGLDRRSFSGSSKRREKKPRRGEKEEAKWKEEPSSEEDSAGERRRGSVKPMRMTERVLGVLESTESSPFSVDITMFEIPRQFSTPRFELYDGRSDPVLHIEEYSRKMAVWTRHDALMCLVFQYSLGKAAARWFRQLPPRKIRTWRELAEKFLKHFLKGCEAPKNVRFLMTIRMRRAETLRSFSARFFDALEEIGPCDPMVVLESFRLAIDPDSPLGESLTGCETQTVGGLRRRVQRFVKIEDDKVKRAAEMRTEGQVKLEQRPKPYYERGGASME